MLLQGKACLSFVGLGLVPLERKPETIWQTDRTTFERMTRASSRLPAKAVATI